MNNKNEMSGSIGHGNALVRKAYDLDSNATSIQLEIAALFILISSPPFPFLLSPAAIPVVVLLCDM